MARSRQWIAREPGGLEVFELVEVDVPAPGPGEVTISVRAAGVNPADAKHVARGGFAGRKPIGYEVSGVLTAIGPGTSLASGGGTVGDEVVAYRVSNGWADTITVHAADVFAKPPSLSHPEAANLLLAGATAAEMLHVTGASAGETVVVHGASGAVGVSVLQQARLAGVHVVGTCSPSSFDVVRDYGGTPVAYGPGVLERLGDAAPEAYAAALDTVGTDEAVDVSLALVADRERIVTIAAPARADTEGIRSIGGTMPASAAFRDGVRAHLLGLAAVGDLVVPMARTYPLADALDAVRFLAGGHPGGKVALLP